MSQRHPGSRRTSKGRGSQEPDDIFVAKVLSLGKWAEANQQVLTVGAIVAAIGIFGLVSWGNARRSMNMDAAEQLEIIHQSINIGDTEGARGDLGTFLDRFEGSAYEGEARLLLGQLYLDNGDNQQALAVLEPLGASPRAPIEFQGAALLGVAYEQEGRVDEAEGVYLTIAERSDLAFQVVDALSAAARLRATQGDTTGAIELYQQILADLDENAPERGLYEMRLRELRGQANT
jgi:predicted negative regulator of RcsB-dependent stress response